VSGRGGGRAARSCHPHRGDEESGTDESHVAQASGEQ
jgi:hypothetical protein